MQLEGGVYQPTNSAGEGCLHACYAPATIQPDDAPRNLQAPHSDVHSVGVTLWQLYEVAATGSWVEFGVLAAIGCHRVLTSACAQRPRRQRPGARLPRG
mmetsp:Transcript_7852/g.19593  ORF Transcript_7852/g.19593 Transcript_7852/m.19593 type:complete len:99 (-) Transcript_7852:354-650(-)